MSLRGERLANLPRLVTLASWTMAALLWVFFIATQQFAPTRSWLLDWHVYAAGAREFLEGTLYSLPLESAYRLPVSEFNYPPLSAIAVIPLLVLPDAGGGTVWVLLNIGAVAGTAFLVARILDPRQPWLWAGLGFLAYTIHPWMRLAFLGNNTPVVLLLVTAFAHQYLRGRDRSAGALLGTAIALKLWPIALIPLLLRDRRWRSMAFVAGVVGFVAVVSLARLGVEVVGPASRAIQATAVIEPDNPVFFVSWLRETQSWWPGWGGYAVAVALAAIPATGLLGIGLGMFAGLAVVPNLWRTYIPTVVVASIFAIRGGIDVRASRGHRARPSLAAGESEVPSNPVSAQTR
jgi:glycosyl transferase family 87